MCKTQKAVISTSKPFNFIKIYDDLTEHNSALRAFGALLSTARLTEMDSGEAIEGSAHQARLRDTQYGLSQIVEILLDKQEEILASHVKNLNDANFLTSPESISKEGANE